MDVQDIPTIFSCGRRLHRHELGTVYEDLGSNVVVLEAMPSILTGVDPDLVRPVSRAAPDLHQSRMATAGKQIKITMEIVNNSG